MNKIVFIYIMFFSFVYAGGESDSGTFMQARIVNLSPGEYLYDSKMDVWGIKTFSRFMKVKRFEDILKFEKVRDELKYRTEEDLFVDFDNSVKNEIKPYNINDFILNIELDDM